MTALATPIVDLDDLQTGASWDNSQAASGIFQSNEIYINASTKIFYFKGTAGGSFENLGSGVTGQALYSFFKDRWKNDPNLPQYEFPMLSITNEQFEFINGWKPDDTTAVTHATSGGTSTTRKMIRTAGWSEVDENGNVGRRYFGAISLGTLGDDDQPYYVQDSSFTATTDTTDYTGPVNEAIQFFGDTGVDASSPINANLASYFKIFVRTRGKTYADADLADIGVTSGVTYIVYRFPVSNATDLNINTTADAALTGATITAIDGDATTISVTTSADHGLYVGAPVTISGTTNYNGTYTIAGVGTTTTFTISDTNHNVAAEATGTAILGGVASIAVNYLANPDSGTGDVVIKGDYAQGVTYAVGDVVFDVANSQGDANGPRWYYVDATTGPSNATTMAADTGNTWTLWIDANAAGTNGLTGQRDIEETDTWSAYTAVIDATNSTKEAVYEYTQYLLRQSSNINDNSVDSTARNGDIADTLAFFVGPTLNTYNDTTIPFATTIDNIASVDVNNVQYNEAVAVTRGGSLAPTSHVAPIVVLVSINFNGNLSGDNDAIFYAYYLQGEGAQAGNDYGTTGAIQVKESNGNNVGQTTNAGAQDGQMTGAQDVPSGGVYEFNYAYDGDTTNGRTGGTPVTIVVVSIGLNTGQYVSTEATITELPTTISLVAPLERNYTNPA